MLDGRVICLISKLISEMEEENYSTFKITHRGFCGVFGYVGIMKDRLISKLEKLRSEDGTISDEIMFGEKTIIDAIDENFVLIGHILNFVSDKSCVFDIEVVNDPSKIFDFGSINTLGSHYYIGKRGFLGYLGFHEGMSISFTFDKWRDAPIHDAGFYHTVFKDKEYINEFVSYLLSKQMDKGKPLNYEEMEKGLSEFLEKKKSNKKIKG